MLPGWTARRAVSSALIGRSRRASNPSLKPKRFKNVRLGLCTNLQPQTIHGTPEEKPKMLVTCKNREMSYHFNALQTICIQPSSWQENCLSETWGVLRRAKQQEERMQRPWKGEMTFYIHVLKIRFHLLMLLVGREVTGLVFKLSRH